MYIIVVGCGRIGLHLSKALMTVGHEVTVIEKDPQRSNNVIEDLGNVIVKGDGSALNMLREAGAGRADLVVAVTGEDADNLAVCQMAKEVFKTPRTVSLVKNPSHDALFKLLGVDRVINSTHLILSNIEDEVPNRVLVHVMDQLLLYHLEEHPRISMYGIQPLHKLRNLLLVFVLEYTLL